MLPFTAPTRRTERASASSTLKSTSSCCATDHVEIVEALGWIGTNEGWTAEILDSGATVSGRFVRVQNPLSVAENNEYQNEKDYLNGE
jgi:hypothetical protein